MIRSHCLKLIIVLAATSTAMAKPLPVQEPPMVSDAVLAAPATSIPAAQAEDPVKAAIARKLAALPTDGAAQDIKERSVLIGFYEQRDNAPLWVAETGLTEKAVAIVREIENAHDWGLDPKAFTLPDLPAGGDAVARLQPGDIADAEVALAVAILKYARYARGGRIIDPTILLTDELDRKPQLIDPEVVIKGIAAAEAPDAYLRGLNPQAVQFERLRQAYLATRNKTLAKRLLANMEEWRWMPEDLGGLHILANIPEFMVHLVKDGKVIYSERIVVGEVGKQTTVFTRNLKSIVFKPMWRVPDSIKERELLPNLRRGGSMFRQYGLELQSKDGVPLDYRKIDWSTTNILDYEVVQPPGPKNVMGIVKFTFPSQHTIFMHDTVDKWMFRRKVRTLSHGCMRLRNPMRMAELVLAEDKGWDAAHVEEVMRTGPRNNQIMIDHKIPVHIVYFTAWVDDNGKVHTYRDIYGHEKRITLALEGRWGEMPPAPNHLAPVEPVPPGTLSNSAASVSNRRRKAQSIVDMVGNALGGGF